VLTRFIFKTKQYLQKTLSQHRWRGDFQAKFLLRGVCTKTVEYGEDHCVRYFVIFYKAQRSTV